MLKKPELKEAFFQEFLIEQLGDAESPLWEAYIESLLVATYVKLKDSEKEKFLKDIKDDKLDEVIDVVENTLARKDYENIATILSEGIAESIKHVQNLTS